MVKMFYNTSRKKYELNFNAYIVSICLLHISGTYFSKLRSLISPFLYGQHSALYTICMRHYYNTSPSYNPLPNNFVINQSTTEQFRNQPIHPEIKQCKFNRGKIFPLLSLLCHFHSHNTVTDFHVFITVFVNLPAHQHMNAFVDINGQCITHAHPQSEMQYSKVHQLPTPLDRNKNLCQCQHEIINNNQP